MGFLLRVWLLTTLPFRLALEVFHAYVWRPKESSTSVADTQKFGHTTNGNSTYSEETPDIASLTDDERGKVEERIEYWWGANLPAPARLRRQLKGLRSMNKVRLPIIVEAYYKQVLGREIVDASSIDTATPLLGARICDVGCGGGYLSEALEQLGADVVGIDINAYDIMAAKKHWEETQGAEREGPEYHNISAKDYSLRHAGEFDLVICSEKLQYRDNAFDIIPSVCKLVKEGGCVVLTTTNRSLPALFFVIGWMEHVAGVMPPFTNRLFRFLKPSEVADVVKRCNFEVVNLAGFVPLGLTLSLKWRMQWMLTSYIGVWYALVGKRLPQEVAVADG